MLLPEILFFICLVAAVLAPMRWALVAFLLLSSIDFAAGRGNIGILNAVKGIALPAYFLWRLRHHTGHNRVSAAAVAWALLAIYAAIAASWSLFPLSALKLAAQMAGSLLICLVFLRAARANMLDARMIIPATLGLFASAGLRSIFDPAYGDAQDRFASFTPAQSFAALLAALYAVALTAPGLRKQIRIALCTSLSAAIILDGSRIWFCGILIASLLALLFSEIRGWIKICGFGMLIIAVALGAGASDELAGMVARHAESNRIARAAVALYRGNMSSAGLGTLRFRERIDALAITKIEDSSALQLIFGRGTSNAAIVTGSLFHNYAVFSDPNRMLHNEWLRILYEWGLIGFALWLTVSGSLALFAIERTRGRAGAFAKPLLIYLPAFLIAFAGENILAGAGSAASVGLLLLIGLASLRCEAPVPMPMYLPRPLMAAQPVGSAARR